MLVMNYIRRVKIKNFILLITLIIFIIILFFYYINKKTKFSEDKIKKVKIKSSDVKRSSGGGSAGNNVEAAGDSVLKHTPIIPEKYNEHIVKMRIMKEKIKNLMSRRKDEDNVLLNISNPLTRNVHIFYYAPVEWYKPEPTEHTGNASLNNDLRLNSKEHRLNVVFYPYYGIYDNTNLDIIAKHFEEIKKMGIGVIILTWTPSYPENLLNGVFDTAISYDLRVAIQIDDYPKRCIESIRNNIKYFINNVGFHAGLTKILSVSRNKLLPLFYIKDITHSEPSNWNEILSLNGELSIRNTRYDSLVLGHITHSEHKSIIRRYHFDGFYTYLPSNGAIYASTWKNWVHLKKFADLYKLLFIPTVGPGFDEKKKQPRTGMLRRHRSNGNYYGVAWRTAISVSPPFVSISSFNNWPEGSQIEQAITKTNYKDYLPGKPTKYLELTQQFIADFIKSKTDLKSSKCSDLLNNTIC